MTTLAESINAFRIDNTDSYQAEVQRIKLADLNKGEVVIKTAYSSINYKDALAGTGKGKILRKFPLVSGIDVAGHVVTSTDSRFKEGDEVLVTGSGLSETRDGGYSEYCRLLADWIIPLPTGLSLKDSMIIGTAGFTAALSLYRMQCLGQTADMGPIVITGASGGVGMLAIDIFKSAGYDPQAITGKVDKFQFLQSLGASQVVSRHDLYIGQRPLEKASWAGALDTIGGQLLSDLSRIIKPWGTIASCGMASGIELHTTVMPFIIRGISLVGINSSGCAYPLRERIWNHLANDWKPQHLKKIHTQSVRLETLKPAFEQMLAGNSFGRTLVEFN